jgi:uncharacterized membrane protein
MISNITIDTGDQRSVTGHLISGTVFSAVFAGSIKGGIATASAIATANYIGTGDILKALTAMSLGAIGVYTTQKVYDKLEIESEKKQEIEDAK